jgi:hypothetical protein
VDVGAFVAVLVGAFDVFSVGSGEGVDVDSVAGEGSGPDGFEGNGGLDNSSVVVISTVGVVWLSRLVSASVTLSAACVGADV